MKAMRLIALLVFFVPQFLWCAEKASLRFEIEGSIHPSDPVEEFLNQEILSPSYENVTKSLGEEKTTKFLQVIEAKNDALITYYSGKTMMVRDVSRLLIVLARNRKEAEKEYRRKSPELKSTLEEDLTIFRDFIAVLVGNKIMEKMVEFKLIDDK